MEKAKAKKAIQKGNMDVARIHAENAIRQKSQSVNYLRMSARVDAVASRVQSALTTRNVNQSENSFLGEDTIRTSITLFFFLFRSHNQWLVLCEPWTQP